ncbi:hypothetical protein L7F22_038212 [Adiantum nelumboides]|nr:hypothetical protein [Adiantum nelumboides]
MSKASVKRSPAKRASKNAVAEEPLLLEATLQKSSPLQREKKRASADFEVSASNSKAPMKVAKAAYQYPRLSKFCYSADDLHSEYGLSLEGKLPRDIADDEISDKDWLTVFKCLHQKNTKLYISSVREEFVDECRLLYQKVYQAAPSNGELLAKFARGFVYERSRASSDPDSRRIAWARFGGAVLDNCKLQKGGLERKINKFRADHGIVKLEASNCDVAVSSIPTISASKLEGRQVVEQPMYTQQVLSIAEGISKELDQQQEQLAKVEVQLQQKRDVSLRNEGLSSAYSGLYTELEELKELEHLKNSPDATPRDIDCKELEVQAITKVLAKVGASSESLNMKQDLDALQEKRDALEDEAKLLIAQQAFMDKATKFIQREGRASMVPTPLATASTLKPIAFVGGSCAACGKPLSAYHMAGVFLLTCQHKYHRFCFAVLCATSTGCSHPNCKEKIPEIAKCWALGTAYTELGETKDGSCCLDSYDEDHSNRSDCFQMKGTASDDTANVLQGMAKVTTENSPILVLEEPSGKMDNASTLVEDKDKNSTVDPPTNFSIDVPPVHEGEDHEKNTTLDPVSKVSIDSAEGDHGKDKIVDPASKLSADNPEESEATDDMDDPELGETLRFMAAQMKKKRKRELEEGPANPNRIKIRVVNYPSSKSLDDSDTPINIDRVPPVYRSLGRADACNDASRPAIILDLNNVLMITHRKSRDPLPPNVSSLYFYIIKDQEDRDITYYVRADAALFILHASQLAKVFIWSSCTLTNLSRRIDRCFSQVKVCFSGWAGQEMCHRASWQMREKPVFFKSLETFLKGMQGLGKYSTLLLDDSYYKNHLNEKGTYVVLPGIEQQSEEQWDGFLRNDVLQFLYTWVDAKEEDRFKIVKKCNFDVSESAEQRLDMLFIKKNLEGGGTIYPPRNSGLHENPEPKNPGSAAGDPGFASGSPRKRGHPRPQYKRPGTQ